MPSDSLEEPPIEGEVPEEPEGHLTSLAQNSLSLLKALSHELRVDVTLACEEAHDRWGRFETYLRGR